MMRIVQMYSHLNGHEHILVHKPTIWHDIEDSIAAIDAGSCLTKKSREKRMVGKLLYSPDDLHARFHRELENRGWKESRTSYWVTGDHRLIRKTLGLPAAEQKREIQEAGQTPIFSYNQTDFVKERGLPPS